VPYLLWYLPAGALVDRWDRRRLMLAADAGRAAALASVAVALAFGSLTLVHVLVVVFVEGSLFVFFQVSESAALPHVVAPAQLPTALAQYQAREHGAELAGRPLGGLLFGLNQALPFVVDALTYLASFVALWFVRPGLRGTHDRRAGRLPAEIAEGVRWLWRQRFLRALLGLIAATNLVFNALAIAAIVRLQELGASPAAIGLLLGLYGAAALVGAAYAPALQRRLPPVLLIIGSLWAWAAAFAALILTSDPVVFGVLLASTGLTGPLFNVVVGGYRYALAPDRLQGRTQAVARLVAWGAIPVGAFVGGVGVQLVGAQPAVVVLAAAMALIAAAATLTPTVRNPPRATVTQAATTNPWPAR
jgi:predicted MFS family arabinose efflux permease